MPKPERKDEKTVAILEIIIEYEELPMDGEIAEILDKAREYAAVKKAELTILKTTKRSVL